MQIDLSQFHHIFRGEAEMLLARIDASLSLLEPGNADPRQLETVFRSAHTLKGAAAALALGEIRDLALALERAFAIRKSGLVDETLLEAAATSTLLVREMLRALGRTSDPLRAAASRARDHLLEFAAPCAQGRVPDVGAQQMGTALLRFQEGWR